MYHNYKRVIETREGPILAIMLNPRQLTKVSDWLLPVLQIHTSQGTVK